MHPNPGLLIRMIVSFIMLPAIVWAQQRGRLTGQIRDEINEGMPGVTVRAENGALGTVSQVDGSYMLELPEGNYTVSFSYLGYETKKITDVTILPGQVATLDVALAPAKSSSLKEVVVTATFRQASVEGLYHRQKNSAAVSDGISADQIKRTPDNNAAQVLRRVSGLTIQDNKFVTVRGMSERYNNVLLNSSTLPSTEPNRRNFSFDVLPANLIDNIVVNKTATPDMPGEFAGGVVQVNTKDIPDENYMSISVGTGYNTMSVGQPFRSLKRSSDEYFGRPGSHRDWWSKNWDDKVYKGYYNTDDWQKIGEYGKRVPNNWGLYQYDYNPLQQYQIALGRLKKLKNENSIGLIAAFTYRHDETRTEEEVKFRIADYRLHGSMYELNTSGAGLLNLAYQTRRHKISLKNIYNRRLNHNTEVLEGDVLAQSSPVFLYTDIISVNDLYQNKLEGEHSLGERRIRIGWNVDRSQLTRLQPDMRNSIFMRQTYGLAEAQGSFSLSNPGLSIMNAKLKEVRYNFSTYISYPFTFLGQEQKLKVGYQGTRRKADFLFNGMKMQHTRLSQLGDEIYGRPDYFIADPKYVRADGLYYRPAGPSFSSSPEGYEGSQMLQATYLMLDLKLTKNLRFIGGARAEFNNMKVNTTTYTFDSTDQLIVREEEKEYKNTDVLPSFNLVYALTAKSNIRLGYSKTLARPDFRERSPFMYFDFYDFTPYFGVAGLKDSKMDNVDLRYEYYPRSGEVFSVSAFYKKFVNPVELFQQVTSSGDGAVNFYFNLKESTNYGLETDFRKSLGFIDNGSSVLKRFYISGNASYILSTVEYDIAQLTAVASGLDPDSIGNSDNKRSRPPQGLSPYIINGGIGYQDDVFGVQLSYNRFGPRLVTGAPYARQDQFENPRDVLDLQLNAKLLKNKMDLRLNISDLLQQAFITYQNAGVSPDYSAENEVDDPKGSNYNPSLDVARYKAYRGSNISLSVSWQL